MAAGDVQRYRGLLGDSVVFADLTPTELDLVMAKCRLIELPAGATVIREDQRVDGLYVILEGTIKFYLAPRAIGNLRRATRVDLNVLGPGRCFGEYSVIDNQASSATAETTTAVRLCFLGRDDFLGITSGNDRLGRIIYANLLRFLVSRLRAKDREVDSILLSG